MHICVVSPDYPTSRTIDFVFVDQLCRALTHKGVKVTVVAPQTLTKCLIRKIPIAKYKTRIYVDERKSLTLIRPKYISIGNLGETFSIFHSYNGKAYRKAVRKGIEQIDIPIDVIYCHFWQSVSAAFPIAQEIGIPLIASSGEEVVNEERIGYDKEHIRDIANYLSGSIHVSTNNKNECAAIGLVNDNKSVVIPNGYDSTLFRPLNKKTSRKKLNISEGDFVVAFVGQFTHRKGTLRLNEALKAINMPDVKALYIGSGPERPDYQGVLVCETVMHDKLPEYLTAADVFVLPTLQEGCCNAIIEAMACGLPVISSDKPFNYDVLDESNAILIDPENVGAIADAINKIKSNNELRIFLSEGALKKAKGLTLDQRAERILNFIKDKVGYDKR